MDRDNGKGIFFGIIGVATLIIAIIGATLAYFSITAKSDKGINVGAAVVKINYIDSTNLAIEGLIPATENVAKAGYGKTTGKCIDDNGYTVCGVYRFSIENVGSDTANITSVLTANENTTTNLFTNLKYIVYDVTTEGSPVVVKQSSVFSTTAGSTTSLFGTDLNATQTIDGGNSKNYEVLIWLNEAGADNDAEQGAGFSASVEVKVSGASSGQISGEIAGAE